MGDEENQNEKVQLTHSDYLKSVGLPETKFTNTFGSVTVSSLSLWSARFLDRLLFAPGRWFRETVVTPNVKDYPYYHRQYRRVPTIDECYVHDYICQREADVQYLRDRTVEKHIVSILNQRMHDCFLHNYAHENRTDENHPCKDIIDYQSKAAINFYIKYGDLSAFATAVDVLMKQKHRMVWERRHGENLKEVQDKRLQELDAVAAE